MTNALIICTCIFTFCAGVIVGGAIDRPTVHPWQLTHPPVEVEEVPDDGEAFIIITAPKHKHPITAALLFDGDAVRIFREVKTI